MLNNNTICAHINAFMRPDKFEICLQCAATAGLEHILVGYDGPEELYEQHKSICNSYIDKVEELRIIKYPFNFGLSATRNALIDETNDCQFILQLDDDNYVPRNVLDTTKFLEKHDKIGMVGLGCVKLDGHMMSDATDFEIVDGFLIKTIKRPKETEQSMGLLFIYPFEYIPNIAIFKRAVFDDIRWDNKYIIGGEHVDFYLNLKENTYWKSALCASLLGIHDHDPPPPISDCNNISGYKGYRWGENRFESERYFIKKWRLKGFVGWKRMFIDNKRYENTMNIEENNIRKKIKEERLDISDFNYSYLYKNGKGDMK